MSTFSSLLLKLRIPQATLPLSTSLDHRLRFDDATSFLYISLTSPPYRQPIRTTTSQRRFSSTLPSSTHGLPTRANRAEGRLRPSWRWDAAPTVLRKPDASAANGSTVHGRSATNVTAYNVPDCDSSTEPRRRCCSGRLPGLSPAGFDKNRLRQWEHRHVSSPRLSSASSEMIVLRRAASLIDLTGGGLHYVASVSVLDAFPS